MRNIIVLTLLFTAHFDANASELTLEQIRSDFKETINHYEYDLSENELQVSSTPQRVRSNEPIASRETEILNLEDEFNGITMWSLQAIAIDFVIIIDGIISIRKHNNKVPKFNNKIAQKLISTGTVET